MGVEVNDDNSIYDDDSDYVHSFFILQIFCVCTRMKMCGYVNPDAVIVRTR